MSEFKVTPNKSYATIENARMAVQKAGFSDLRHFYIQEPISESKHSGRWFPVFVGESAAARGVHFSFNVVG